MLKRILNEFEYQLGLGQSWSRMISNMIKQKFSITISWPYQSVSSIPNLKSSKIVKSQPSSSATPCCLSLPSLLSSSLREIASALLRIWRRTRSVKKVRPVLNTSVVYGHFPVLTSLDTPPINHQTIKQGYNNQTKI